MKNISEYRTKCPESLVISEQSTYVSEQAPISLLFQPIISEIEIIYIYIYIYIYIFIYIYIYIYIYINNNNNNNNNNNKIC